MPWDCPGAYWLRNVGDKIVAMKKGGPRYLNVPLSYQLKTTK